MYRSLEALRAESPKKVSKKPSRPSGQESPKMSKGLQRDAFYVSDLFYFFLLGGGEGVVLGDREGGGRFFLLKIPGGGGGGLPEGGGG